MYTFVTAKNIFHSLTSKDEPVFVPVLIYNFLQSVRLLSDGMRSFNDNCLAGLKANRDVMRHNL